MIRDIVTMTNKEMLNYQSAFQRNPIWGDKEWSFFMKHIFEGFNSIAPLLVAKLKNSTIHEFVKEGVVERCTQMELIKKYNLNTGNTSQLVNKKINSVDTGQIHPAQFGEDVFAKIIQTYIVFVEKILGLKEEKSDHQQALLEILLKLYAEAKTARYYEKVDEIRSSLKEMGFVVKDMKDKIDWAYEE
jgi:cysteinyl-tRNA synthetase